MTEGERSSCGFQKVEVVRGGKGKVDGRRGGEVRRSGRSSRDEDGSFLADGVKVGMRVAFK